MFCHGRFNQAPLFRSLWLVQIIWFNNNVNGQAFEPFSVSPKQIWASCVMNVLVFFMSPMHSSTSMWLDNLPNFIILQHSSHKNRAKASSSVLHLGRKPISHFLDSFHPSSLVPSAIFGMISTLFCLHDPDSIMHLKQCVSHKHWFKVFLNPSPLFSDNLSSYHSPLHSVRDVFLSFGLITSLSIKLLEYPGQLFQLL